MVNLFYYEYLPVFFLFLTTYIDHPSIHSFIRLFVYSFNKYLVSDYYLTGTGLY